MISKFVYHYPGYQRVCFLACGRMLRCRPKSRAAKPRERTTGLFARRSLWLKPLNRSGKQRTICGCAKIHINLENSHWLTNREKSMLWLVWNVASLIPLANSMNCFAGRTSFTFRSNHASCITVLFKLHKIDRRLQSNSWSRLYLWKFTQKVSVQLL